jgi:hypothetical protein
MTKSIHEFGISEGQIKWTIFLFLIALFPAFFFLFFDIPKWPVLVVLTSIIPRLIGEGAIVWLLVFVAESLFWIGVFYYFSVMAAWKLSSIKPIWKYTFFSAILLAILGLGMSPIFDFTQYTVHSDVTAFFLYFTDKQLF